MQLLIPQILGSWDPEILGSWDPGSQDLGGQQLHYLINLIKLINLMRTVAWIRGSWDHGIPVLSMDIQWYPWISMDIQGFSIDVHGWCGYSWLSLDMHWHRPWISMSSMHIHWYPSYAKLQASCVMLHASSTLHPSLCIMHDPFLHHTSCMMKYACCICILHLAACIMHKAHDSVAGTGNKDTQNACVVGINTCAHIHP